MIRLILIDDHKLILDGISALLESESEIMVVGEFQDARRAIDYLDKNAVDLILTDLDMPQMNGEEVVEFCKAKFPSTKIIVLSMHNEKSVIKHLIQLGADGYLVKSAGKEEILKAIRNVHTGSKFFSDEVMQSLIQEDKIAAPTNDPALKILSEREIEVIKHIANGMSSKEIGDQLFISPRTVETHRNNICKKLDIQGVAGIIRFAFQHQLVD